MPLSTRLKNFLSRPVPADSAAAFRILFGLLMFVGALRFLAYGWVQKLYVEPKFFFTYDGFSWVRPWPSFWMEAHFVVLAVLALFIAAGFYYRLSAFLFFLGFTYIELIDKSNYLNHYYFVSIVSALLVLMPLHACYSLDAWRDRRIFGGKIPAWCLYALRLQIGFVYFFAGLAKINAEWLLKAQPLKIWLAANAELPLIGFFLAWPATAFLMSWAGMLFDLTVPAFLIWKKSRSYAYAAVVVFHVFTWILFRIGMFPWIMIAATTVFFSPDWPTKILSRFGLRFFKPSLEASLMFRTRWQTPIFILLALHFAVQTALPLRYLLYPSNVFWSEEAYRFSWRVMLMEKSGSVEYRVSDESSGKTWTVSASDYLKPYQEKQMTTQPDMILALAKRIAKDFGQKGYPDVSVKAVSFVSWNGRPDRPFVDPNVDLVKINDLFGVPRSWIMSLD